MIVQCCVCQRIRQGERWVRVSDPLTPGTPVSHGYCPDCAAKAFEEIAKYASSTAGKRKLGRAVQAA